ncbi:MAG: hypothetical protein ACOXZ4_04565 [Sphaerochaetaceae bacterium]
MDLQISQGIFNGELLIWGGIEVAPIQWVGNRPNYQGIPGWSPHVSIIMSSSGPNLEFVKITDPSKRVPFSLSFNFATTYPNGSHDYLISTSPTEVPIKYDNNAGGNLSIILGAMNLNDTWKGSYSSFVRMQFYADYGTSDQVLLDEIIMNLFAFYKEKDANPGGQPVFTNLDVVSYPAAANVDVISMAANNSSLVVGSVNFSSTDNRNNKIYKIKVSPNQNPNSTFAFQKSGGGAAIPYKVNAVSHNQPVANAFEISNITKGPAGYYQKHFEVAISNVNQGGGSIAAGAYTSGIKVELIIQ